MAENSQENKRHLLMGKLPLNQKEMSLKLGTFKLGCHSWESFGENPLSPPPNFRHVGLVQLPNDYLRPHQTHLHIGFRP